MSSKLKKILLLLVLILMLMVLGVWVLGAVRAKGFVENALRQEGISYEKVSVGGSPKEYKIKIYKPRFNKKSFVGYDVQTNMIDVNLKSSSLFNFDHVQLLFSEGLDVDLGFLNLQFNDMPEINIVLNENKDLIKDLSLILGEFQTSSDTINSEFRLELEDVNISLEEEEELSVYSNRNVTLKDLFVRFNELQVSARGKALVDKQQLSKGDLNLVIGGYDVWLDNFELTQSMSAELTQLVKIVLDHFRVEDHNNYKMAEVNFKFEDDEININNKPASRVWKDILNNNPEVAVLLVSMIQEVNQGGMPDLTVPNLQF